MNTNTGKEFFDKIFKFQFSMLHLSGTETFYPSVDRRISFSLSLHRDMISIFILFMSLCKEIQILLKPFSALN